MQQIIECVPNFSEGRRAAVVAQIVAAIAAAPGVVLLGHSLDADHNRSVVTFAGDAAAVEEAAFRACARATALIDLGQQRGAHPRIGATDVIPFIPLRGASLADCVALARRLGERIGRELAVPVYLYEAAAARESNRNLAAVRRGEYEGLQRAIESDPARAPDFGPHRLGSAGAVAIGARLPLIAFNVNLAGTDIHVAKAIARSVRASSGGLPSVKALGLALPGRGLVQVSLNLTDYTQTSLFRAFDAVQREAERHGIAIAGSELIGLVPAAALLTSDAGPHQGIVSEDNAAPFRLTPDPAHSSSGGQDDPAYLDAVARRLRLPALSRNQVLEFRLADVLQGRDSLAHRPQPPETSPAPGAAPLLAAQLPSDGPPPAAAPSMLAGQLPSDEPPPAAVPSMLAGLTPNDEPPLAGAPPPVDFLAALSAATPAPAGGSAAAYAGAMAASLVMMIAGLTLLKRAYAAVHDEMRAIHAEASYLQAALGAAVAADANAYAAVMDAYKLPKESPERAPAVERAMRSAALVSLQVAEQSARVLALARRASALGLKTAASDGAVAAYLANAAVRGALLNAKENVSLLTDGAAAAEFSGRIAQVEETVGEAR